MLQDLYTSLNTKKYKFPTIQKILFKTSGTMSIFNYSMLQHLYASLNTEKYTFLTIQKYFPELLKQCLFSF